MYCNNCGCKNDKGVKYCRECGHKLTDNGDDSEKMNLLPVNIIGSILTLVLIIGVTVGSIRFIREHRETAKANLEAVMEKDSVGYEQNNKPADKDSEQVETAIDVEGEDEKIQEQEISEKIEDTENDITEEEKQKDLFLRFKKYLNNSGYGDDEYFCCNFAYIDDDSIPELIIDPYGDGRSDSLLYIKNGRVRESGIWAPGTISYKERENLIINDSSYWIASDDGTIFEVARIKKGKYFVDEQLQEINYRDGLGNIERTEIKIDSNYVSKEDYDEEIEKYRNLKGLKVFEFKYDTLKKAFKNLKISPIDTSLLYNDKQLAKKKEDKSFDPDSYVIASSDIKRLKNRDLKNLSAKELTYARNEIFARHGYVFNSPELNNFFKKKNWYTPDDSYDGKLNDVESKNIELIKNYQADNNGSSGITVGKKHPQAQYLC